MAESILVPVDDSRHARNAFERAATAFEGANLIVLHALEPFDVYSVTEEAAWDEEFQDRREREAEALLAEYESLADDLGVDVETRLAHGRPDRAILGAVDDLDVDQVVIGSRGRSGIGRVLLGSVAETVAKRSPVSVTIVRPGE